MTMVETSPLLPQSDARAARERKLWAEFKDQGAADARIALFSDYLPFARKLARQHHYRGSEIEFQDLVQCAYAGLLEALDRFDPTREVPFAAFARRRINGSIVDGVAKASEYRQQIAVGKSREKERIRSLLPGDPSPQTDAQAYQAFADLAAGLALGFMLEEGMIDATDDITGTGNGYESAAWKQTVELVADAVNSLGDREQIIIRAHYEGGLPFDRIGAILGLSKGRVSQLHRSALGTLRKRLALARSFLFKQ